MAEIQHWQMWRTRCALARCSATAQQDLCGFAFERFRRYLQKLGPTLAPPPAADAWHAFETHLALGKTRSAKAWKEWLFARGGNPPTQSCIQGGASLILRDVVREQLRHEHPPRWMSSLDAPVRQTAAPGEQTQEACSLADLLPDQQDPLGQLEANECRELASQLYPSLQRSLSRRARLALIAHHVGIPLYHNAVTQAAQCGKSSLCNALQQALRTLGTTILQAYPHEDPRIRLTIATALLQRMVQNLLPELEKEAPQLFRYIKEEHENT